MSGCVRPQTFQNTKYEYKTLCVAVCVCSKLSKYIWCVLVLIDQLRKSFFWFDKFTAVQWITSAQFSNYSLKMVKWPLNVSTWWRCAWSSWEDKWSGCPMVVQCSSLGVEKKEQTEAPSNVYCCCANSLERKKLKVAVDEQNNANGFKTLWSAFLPADFGAKVNFCQILFKNHGMAGLGWRGELAKCKMQGLSAKVHLWELQGEKSPKGTFPINHG